MNKTLLNEIIAEVLRSGEILSKSVDVCLVEQEMSIDIRRFQNPITDNGDIRMQSIDSSERIADLINSFGMVSDLEECYMIALEGMQEVSVVMGRMRSGKRAVADSADMASVGWYVDLSREIQKLNVHSAGDETDEYISTEEI